jgi:transcriptional regulator with XRE-family HTH domain
MNLNQKIGQRITKLRKEQNKTLEKLAYESGISKGGLSETERGLREIRISTLIKICETLEISLKNFFDFEGCNLND